MFNLQARYQPWFFEKHLAHLDDNPWSVVRSFENYQEAAQVKEVLERHNPATEYEIKDKI